MTNVDTFCNFKTSRSLNNRGKKTVLGTGNPGYGNYDKSGKITFLPKKGEEIGKREIANKRQRTTD